MSSSFVKERRTLLKALGGVALAASLWPLSKYFIFNSNKKYTSMQGVAPVVAHRLRAKDFPKPSQVQHAQVVIVGSGIAGLTAARQLQQNNITDLRILELEPSIGGNSAWGENNVGVYPIAAHYLPIISNESDFLIDFLKEENIITGFDEHGLPQYNELYLCHDLKERLYINGQWQEGLVPSYGLTEQDNDEIERFFNLMAHYKHSIGNDGRHAFCIPIMMSSQDPAYIALDNLTMSAFLEKNAFHNTYLKWYVNYCMRDDYGAGADVVSAWAGIHYFASRRSKSANTDNDDILVWPQGNGFLAQRLAKNLGSHITTGALVYDISPEKDAIAVTYFDLASQQSIKVVAKAVINATPRFVAQKICHTHYSACFSDVHTFSYSPWLVANITLNKIPASQSAKLAWDNVSFYSPSVGYVDTGHQLKGTEHGSRIITYYLPLDQMQPTKERERLLHQDEDTLTKLIVTDLEKIHSNIGEDIQHIDIRRMGHAMIRPTPNMIWGQARRLLKRSQDGLFFAHSDMSGISIFEEAYWQGLTTAKEVLQFIKGGSA